MTENQLTRDDLKTMTPDQIVDARATGRLNDLLGVPSEESELTGRAERLEPVSRDELRRLNRQGRHDLVAAYAPHTDRITN